MTQGRLEMRRTTNSRVGSMMAMYVADSKKGTKRGEIKKQRDAFST
jgi:hypothetical protein